MAYTWPSAPLSGVISSVPPRRLLALPIDETTTSSWLPGCAYGGSVAVTITAATFFSCMFLPAGSVTPSCESMFVMLCVVNGVCMVWSPVLSSPTTRP
ncbi:hypothetical protein D3C81_793580 [compost metagenome]